MHVEKPFIEIGARKIGPGQRVYIVAEMSANHNQDFNQAVRILHVAKEAGADAVKLQTYTPDTMTIQSDREYFHIGKRTRIVRSFIKPNNVASIRAFGKAKLNGLV